MEAEHLASLLGAAGVNQAPDLTGPAHSPTAAQSCKCVSCPPRPRLALPAGTPASGAVSGRGCWAWICC